jgi:DNA-binding response OmpR family regulator
VVNLPAQSKKILIVDDSPDYLSFVQQFLEGEGFQVDTAESTDSMLTVLGTWTPDMVISDVRIPGDAAFAVLNQLRSDDRTRAIPVLLCTAALQEVEESAEHLRREGVEILLKPFDIDVLLDKVRRLTHATEMPLA